MATPQNPVELWQIYVEGLQKLSQFWEDTWVRIFPRSRKVSSAEPLRQSLEILLELTNLYWNIYENTFGSFLLSPTLGYTREFNNKLFKGFDAWINFYKASQDYQVVLVDVWVRAFEELMRELVSSEEKGESIQNWQQFLQVWSSAFDRAFAQTFRSEDALEIQGKFLNAGMTYRLHQQQVMEVFLKMNDLPSKSEVDEVHRSIYELRKEIKNLKKTLAESRE